MKEKQLKYYLTSSSLPSEVTPFISLCANECVKSAYGNEIKV